MSQAYICDLTGDIVDFAESNEKEFNKLKIDILGNGKEVDVYLTVNVDAWNKSKDSHIRSDLWDTIMTAVKDWLVADYGP
jgi:hypothetical protein